MKKLFFLLCILTALNANSQNVVGYWYGSANVNTGNAQNNYLVEMILQQPNKNTVTGIINYYFRNTFRSYKINGTFNSQNRQLVFFNIPLTYFGSNERFEVDCHMDFIATLRVAKAGSNLGGRFISKPQYRIACPDVLFDFQLNKDAGNQDSILKALRNFKETYQVWTPSATDTLVAVNIQDRPIVNYVVTNQYKDREKTIAQEIEVDSDSLKIDFYDNGEIDGDSISIFYNDRLLASTQKLSAKAIQLNIALDSTKVINEVSMFADNLGSIPPNTALMIVYDGKKRYEVRLSSSLDKNATVRIRKKKK